MSHNVRAPLAGSAHGSISVGVGGDDSTGGATALWLADAIALGEALALADDDADAEADSDALADDDADALGEASVDGEALGDGDSEAETLGPGLRAASSSWSSFSACIPWIAPYRPNPSAARINPAPPYPKTRFVMRILRSKPGVSGAGSSAFTTFGCEGS